MEEDNKTVVRELFAAWATHDVGRASALIGEGCNGGGPEGLRRELEHFLAAFPDLELTLEDMLAEGDRVATRITMRGTHQGALMGVAATGQPALMKANHIFVLAGGKIVQRHGQMDRLELIQQLGMKLIPAGEPD